MNLSELVEKMDVNMHAAVRRAVELGKWPNGVVLSKEDKELCMQAIIAYESKLLPEEARAGYIDTTRVEKTSCNSDHDHSHAHDEEPSQLKWSN